MTRSALIMRLPLLLLLGACVLNPVFAADILVARIAQPFEATMPLAKGALADAGFTIAKVQRIDKAMRKVDYETAAYRIIHFGRADENNRLMNRCPELIAWLPLRMTLAAERDQTLIFTLNPETPAEMVYPVLGAVDRI